MKKRYAFICILVNLIGVAVIPANLFLISLPEYITVLAAVLMGAALLLFFIKSGGKVLSKILLSVCTAIFAGFTLFGAYCNPYWNSLLFKDFVYTSDINRTLNSRQAIEDIDYAMQYLNKDHPVFLNGTPDEVQKAYNLAVDELRQADCITVNLLNQKIQNIVSVLNDAHTCSFIYHKTYHYLEHSYSRSKDGDRLIQVNGIALEDLLTQKSDLYCYEVESWGLQMLRGDLSTLEGLQFLGIDVQNGVSYTYSDENGKTETVVYHENDFVTSEEYDKYNKLQETAEKPFVSYNIDAEKSLAVFTLTQCNYNDEYRRCLKGMFTEIEDKGIQNVVVDLRDNSGGNSMVVDEFIRYLDVDSYQTDTSKWRMGFLNLSTGDGIVQNKKYTDLTFTGNLYLLTSSGTFSSAMMFAEYVKDNSLGTIIGEAPGNTPSGYGDIATFMLPNSGLYLQVSTKQFQGADKETAGVLVVPDTECYSDDALDVLYDELYDKND